MNALHFKRCIGCGFRGGENDWVGLKAALILSKQQKPNRKRTPNVDESSFPQEDIGCTGKKVKFSSDECMDLDDTSSSLQQANHEDRVLSMEWTCKPYKALQHRIWYKEGTEQEDRFQSTVDMVADTYERVNAFISWRHIPPEMLDGLRSKVFCSITRFVLSILDLDDIANTRPKQKISKYRTLCKKLMDLVKADSYTWDDICKMPSSESKAAQVQQRTMMWLGVAEGGVDEEAFVGLNELDVGHILAYGGVSGLPGTKVYPYASLAKPPKSNNKCSELRYIMETFVPLKLEYKVQLNLELSDMKSFRILDYLFVEACKDIVSVELLKDLETQLDVSNDKAQEIMSSFLETVYRAVLLVAEYKAIVMRYFQRSVEVPLKLSPYGRFDDEVFEVVRIADHERRIRCHGFIGVDDILRGLSFSRVGNDSNVQLEISRNYSPDVPPTMPPFKIYKWAGDCAEHFDKGEPAGLEHLALAVIAVKRGDRSILLNTHVMEGLKTTKNHVGHKAEFVKMDDLKYENEPIRDFKTLIRAINSGGLELPEIRCQPVARGPADSSVVV